MKICRMCGREHDDEARLCAACGSLLPSAEESAEKSAERGASVRPEKVIFRSQERFITRGVPYRVRNRLTSSWFGFMMVAFFSIILGMIFRRAEFAIFGVVALVFSAGIKKRLWWAMIGGTATAVMGTIFMLAVFLVNDYETRKECFVNFSVPFLWMLLILNGLGGLYALRKLEEMWAQNQADGTVPMRSLQEMMRERRDRIRDRVISIVLICAFAGGSYAYLSPEIKPFWEKASSYYDSLNVGVWDGTRYQHDFLNLAYALPDGWSRLSDEALRDYNGTDDPLMDGGALFYAYGGKDVQTTAMEMMLCVTLQERSDFTSGEILAFFCEYNKEEYAKYGVQCTAEEICNVTLAGQTWSYVKETLHYTEANASYHVYTYLVQKGHYSFYITVYAYDPIMTDEMVQKLVLGAFSAIGKE